MPDSEKYTVAVVFDFDDTLAPDSTSQLLAALGVDPHSFWRDQVEPLVEAGWDPVPAYLYRVLEHARSSPDPLTKERLLEVGSSLELYPGVSDLFDRLRAHASGSEVELDLEFYIISSGLQTLIDASPIRGEFTQVWASDLHHAEGTGEALFPSNVVSFTDKTRYLFHVHKRLIARRGEFDPFEVNRKLGPADRSIPFEQLIYVGDGYTDVPCFSLVQERGGIALAVVDYDRTERWGRAWGFIEDGRALNVSPTDFRQGSSAEMVLRMALQSIEEKVLLRADRRRA